MTVLNANLTTISSDSGGGSTFFEHVIQTTQDVFKLSALSICTCQTCTSICMCMQLASDLKLTVHRAGGDIGSKQIMKTKRLGSSTMVEESVVTAFTFEVATVDLGTFTRLEATLCSVLVSGHKSDQVISPGADKLLSPFDGTTLQVTVVYNMSIQGKDSVKDAVSTGQKSVEQGPVTNGPVSKLGSSRESTGSCNVNGSLTHALLSVLGVLLISHGPGSNEADNGVRDIIKVASSGVDRLNPAAGTCQDTIHKTSDQLATLDDNGKATSNSVQQDRAVTCAAPCAGPQTVNFTNDAQLNKDKCPFVHATVLVIGMLAVIGVRRLRDRISRHSLRAN